MRKLLIQGDSKSNLTKYLGLMQILVDDLHNREVKVLGELVYSYLQHRDKILDEEMLWEYVLGTGNRKKICEELEMEAYNFQNVLSGLRKKGVVVGNRVHKGFIPVIGEDGSISIAFEFKIKQG